jgi:hypothetical protein
MCAAIFTRIFHRAAPPFSTVLNTLAALNGSQTSFVGFVSFVLPQEFEENDASRCA